MTEREYNRFKARDWRSNNLERARAKARARYAAKRNEICERNRERYANDAEYRARRLEVNRRSYERRA